MAELDAAPWRMSLRMMLLLTALAAFGCAALAYANEWWLVAMAAVALLTFMAAIVAAAIDRGARQAFAVGFLICGALHLAGLRWVDDFPTRRVMEQAYYLIGPARFQVGRTGTTVTVSPPGTSASSPGQLQDGDTGAPVRALQAALNEHLTPSPQLQVDGDFGFQTQRAVITLQNSVGHQPDGIVTLAIWRALGPVGLRELKRNGAAGFLNSAPGEQFIEIGEWLATLLVAYAGGHLAQAMYVRRRELR